MPTPGKKAVNERIYVFSTDAGNRTTNSISISAHGERARTKTTFKVPKGTQIKFYTKDSEDLTVRMRTLESSDKSRPDYEVDDCLLRCARGVPVAVETLNENEDCVNYTLTKWEKSLKAIVGPITNLIDPRHSSYGDILGLLADDAFASDIATIRHRPLMKNITLSEVVSDLKSYGAYCIFHCVFCRSIALF